MDLQKSCDEFEAARRLVDVLKHLQPDEQARAMRWAQEKLIDGAAIVPLSVASSGTARGGHELTAALKDPAFRRNHAAVDKLLYLLGAAQKLKPDAFEKILPVQGRRRCYIGKSEQEIEESGMSTQPRQIPGTTYWVMTNSPTGSKQELLGTVLQLLAFSQSAVKEAAAAID